MTKRSENDQTSDLKHLLQESDCEDVLFDQSARTKSGALLKPDIQFHYKSKYYVIEAKTTPQTYGDAFDKAIKDSRELLEEVEIAFAVLWPSGTGSIRAGYISKDTTGKQRLFKTKEELTQWIVQIVETKKTLAPVNTDKLLHALNELVDRFYRHYQKVPLDDIQEIFGGKSFFETVLSDSGAKEEEVQSLRKVAAFLIVNQLFFYGILAKRTGIYPALKDSEIRKTSDVQLRFDRVLEDDYAPVFGVPVLKITADETLVEDLRYSVRVIDQILLGGVSHDVLGKVFHNLIPFKLRKIVAAYYTNSEAGDLLAGLAIEKPTDKVFDPACGSGTLLVSAYHRKMALLTQKSDFGPEDHKRFLSKDIFGSDIMPFAAHLAAINLTLQRPDTFVDILNILIEDSTRLMPGMAVEQAGEKLTQAFAQKLLSEYSGEKRKVQKSARRGAIALKSTEREPVQLEKFDVVIMNPPFTRFQRLSPEYKQNLLDRFHETKYSELLHGQLGLQGHFMLLADRFLKDEGRIAAVLPATTFTISGFSEIIRFFFSNYEIKYIISGVGRAAFSENTSLREVLFVAQKKKPSDNATANICFISQSPSDMDAASVGQLITRLRNLKEGEQLAESYVFSRKLLQKTVVANPRELAHILNLPLPTLQQLDEMYNKMAHQSKVFSSGKEIFKGLKWGVFENKRGVEKNGYYEISILPPTAVVAKDHDVWILDRQTDESIWVKNRKSESIFRIPKSAVMPQFRRFSGQKRISLDPAEQYVVCNSFPEIAIFLSATGATNVRIQQIKNELASLNLKKYLVSGSANVFLFYRGDLSALNSNLLCVTSSTPAFGGPGGAWIMNIPEQQIPLIALYFNSSFFILQLLKERKETRGAFLEVDKYALESIMLPDPRKMNDDQRDELQKLWLKLNSEQWPQLAKQLEEHFKLRTAIDLAIASLLGIPENKKEKVVLNLQSSLAAYINMLKTTMGGK